jgi:hypothetical protein
MNLRIVLASRAGVLMNFRDGAGNVDDPPNRKNQWVAKRTIQGGKGRWNASVMPGKKG